MSKISLVLVLSFIFGGQMASADAPKVGKKAAARYFQVEAPSSAESQISNDRAPSNVDSLSPEEHFLTFGFSNYVSSDSYRWSPYGQETQVGKWGLDMMYRIGKFSNTIDQALRVSYNEYDVGSFRASKMSFLYALTLPDAGSQFPLYFGAAAGGGVFLKQVPDKSPLSLDYQMYLGLRLFNVMDKTGFYVEGGLRNHLLLTSDGQLNGSFISAGAVFTF